MLRMQVIGGRIIPRFLAIFTIKHISMEEDDDAIEAQDLPQFDNDNAGPQRAEITAQVLQRRKQLVFHPLRTAFNTAKDIDLYKASSGGR